MHMIVHAGPASGLPAFQYAWEFAFCTRFSSPSLETKSARAALVPLIRSLKMPRAFADGLA